ncbi:MAG: phage/plasmid primase, P4 family [Phycisphaerae bacterium]|jgi:phage/plasmid-associated DNA primase
MEDKEQYISPEPYSLAMTILSENFTSDLAMVWRLRNWRGDFYLWHEGCYKPLSDNAIKNFVGSLVAELVCKGKIRKFSSHLRNEIIEAIRSQTGIPDHYELNTWLREPNLSKPDNCIVTANAIVYTTIELKDGKKFVLGHSPEFFSLNILPYRYEEKADCPKWLEFLDEITSGDKEMQTLLCQWAGYLLRNDLNEQKFLLCFGSGANGKGVFFRIMESMLGDDNCSHVPLHQFANSFALGSTLGKKLNSTSESSEEVCKCAESLLKSYVAGDRMDFARKFREPIRAIPTAKVMIATNELPRFSDPSCGIWRRMILVPFNVTIPPEKQDKQLVSKLTVELPGIFNWALQGVKLLKEHKGFIVPTSSVDAMKSYRSTTDPARMFLEENFISAQNCSGEPVQKVYNAYRKWCEAGGYNPLTINQLGQRVLSVFPMVQKIRKRIADKRDNYYEFLSLIKDSQVYDDIISNEPLFICPPCP